MRPHVRGKSEGMDEYRHWAPLFTQYHLDVAVECDSHMMKVTWPLLFDPQGEEGFRRDDRKGTLFLGEGGWGAPLRTGSDQKSWTRHNISINHFFLIQFEPNQPLKIKPIGFEETQDQWESFTHPP